MQEKEETIDLRGLFRLLRKRLGLIILCTFIAAVLGSVYTFFIATPIYTASTQLVAKLPDSDNSAAYAGQVTGNIQMANTINQVIVSPAILDKVQANLNLNSDFQKDVTSTSPTNSQVITITVKNPNPYTAKKIADETAKVFSEDAKHILNVTNVSILSEAKAQTNPVSPRPKLYIAISAAVGLVVGIGLTLLLEVLNNKVTSEQDIEALGLSVLGMTSFAADKDFKENVSTDSELPQGENVHEVATRTRRTR